MSEKALQDTINIFIKQAGTSPAQKSAEWHAIRATTIGGSEVATVLGLNPFSSCKNLIADKSGINKNTFSGNLATRWGNMFEPLTREWAQRVLLMTNEIQETGSVEGVIPRQRYSPDGVGVVQLLDEDNKPDHYIILFEFKAPFKSIPDGKIPKHYVPQIQTGLLSIPICDLGIFVNNCYRKCALKNIGFTLDYDTSFHSGDLTKRLTKKQKITEVLACGVIGFYQTKEHYEKSLVELGYGSDNENEDNDKDDVDIDPYLESDNPALDVQVSEYDINILINSNETPMDFGTAKEKTLNRLFELCEEKRITAIHYPMILNQAAVNALEFIADHTKEKPVEEINVKKIIKLHINQFIAHCDSAEHHVIGYLPWKLVKSNILTERRDENWKQVIEESIVSTLTIIDAIKSSADPQKTYEAYYPSIPVEVEDHTTEADMFTD